LFVRSARTALTAYAWPGNVRELRNVVELLCILREGKTVRVQDLPPNIRHGRVDAALQSDSLSIPINRSLEEIMDLVIDAALAAESGNLTRAAQRLKVSVRTLQRRAKRS
jgi:DNA-binding NtrC family response regulator